MHQGWEMAPVVTCLLCQPKGPSSNPRSCPGVNWLTSPAKWMSFSSVRDPAQIEIRYPALASDLHSHASVLMRAPITHKHMYAHTHTETETQTSTKGRGSEASIYLPRGFPINMKSKVSKNKARRVSCSQTFPPPCPTEQMCPCSGRVALLEAW